MNMTWETCTWNVVEIFAAWGEQSQFLEEIIRYDDCGFRRKIDLSSFGDAGDSFYLEGDCGVRIDLHFDLFGIPAFEGRHIKAIPVSFYTKRMIPLDILTKIARKYKCDLRFDYRDPVRAEQGFIELHYNPFSEPLLDVEMGVSGLN
jgi:hypothetical protein